MAQSTLKLYQAIEQKEAEIQAAKEGKFLCGDTFRPEIHSGRDAVDIPMANLNEVRRAARKLFIISQTDELLGLADGKHQGYPLKDWWHDFKLRVTQIALIDKMNELDTLKAEVEAIMSVKEKKTVKSTKIAEKLSKL